VPDPRGEVAEWKTLPDYLPPLSNSVGRDRNLDAVGQRTKKSDVASALEDEEGFGDRFADRQLPKFFGESELPRVTRHSSVDRVFAHPEYSGIVDAQRGWSGRTGGLADWKRSTSDDVTLDAAISKMKERYARRRLLEKWLKEVRTSFTQSFT